MVWNQKHPLIFYTPLSLCKIERPIFASICEIKSNILNLNESNIKILLYGNDNLSEAQNSDILNATVKNLQSSMVFEKDLYYDKFAKIYTNHLSKFDPSWAVQELQIFILQLFYLL